jgi:serine/threonine protein kinase
VLRETARRAVGLRHEGLVTVLEATDDWIAADLSSGVSLATVLAALRRDPAPAEVTRTLLGALVPVGRALGEAHARGLVHRGVSTRKIDLGEDGTMRLRDLGHDPTRGGRPPTPDVPPLGSPHHLAPEQCGEAGEIGVAADVYSFATVAWTVAAGHPPHNARSLRGLLRRIASGPPPAGAIEERFGPDLARELTGALATAPGDRPGTLDELLGALTPA